MPFSKSPFHILRQLYRGARFVGASNAARTVLYRPRRALYDRRFGGPQAPSIHGPVGRVMSIHETETGLFLTMEQGVGSVDVVAPAILRVRVFPGTHLPPYHSYATILPSPSTPVDEHFLSKSSPSSASPTVPFHWEADEEAIHVRVEGGVLHIRRSPWGLRWEDASAAALSLDTQTLAWEGAETHWRQAFPQDILWYGLGERAFPLALPRRAYTLTTLDPEGYHPGKDPLYMNIPFLMGVHQGRTFGILLDRMSDGRLVLRKDGGLDYHITGPEFRLDIIFGPEPAQVLARYADLTGHAAMPPLWTLGYHQSRWSYENADIVREIAHQFRKRAIPCDAIHFDIDYMDGFRCFTWDKTAFPDLPGLLEELHDQGFKAVAMIDPGIKVDMAYDVCADGVAKEMFCKLPDGRLFHGPVWPGECYFPDFTDPRVRAWWGTWYQRLLDAGFDGFWNDMNEPTLFGGNTFPHQVQHDGEGRGAAHWQVHSAYGMQMVRATYEGLSKLRPDQRHWVLTRSAYAGTQRYASGWTADNYSAWEDLRVTPAMLLNLGLSGMGFVGSDVGGFHGAPSPELYARWLAAAIFHPFLRTHTAKGTPWQEPWRYGPEVEDASRRLLQLRYRLLPAIYTAFWQYAIYGLPLMRPMFFEDPGDKRLLTLDDQWFLGDHLLAAPVLEPGVQERDVWLPAGEWYDFWTDERFLGPDWVSRPTPLDQPPLFIRAGAVLPMGPVQQFVDEKPDAPWEWHIYPGSGISWLYEDDGRTLAYRQGYYRLTRFDMKHHSDHLRIERQVSGLGGIKPRPMRVIFHGVSVSQCVFDDEPYSVLDNQVEISDGAWRLLRAHLS